MKDRRVRVGLVLMSVLFLAGCSARGLLPADESVDIGLEAPQIEFESLFSMRIGQSQADGLRLRPVLADGALYAASVDGRVVALDPVSGETRWAQDLDVRVAGALGAGDGLLALGTASGEVIALERDGGAVRWRQSLSSEVLAPPAVGQASVVVRTADGHVFALDAANGEQRWLYSRNVPALTLRGHSSPVLVNDGVVAGFDNGRLSALDLATGSAAWESTVAVPEGRTDLARMVDIDADPLVDRGDLFAGAYQGRVAGVALGSGEVAWARELSVTGGLAVDDERLYVTDAQGRVWALDRRNGASVWRAEKLRGLRLAAPSVAGEYLLVAASDGSINALDRRNGELVGRRTVGSAGITVKPLVADGRVYLQDLAGRLHAIGINDKDD